MYKISRLVHETSVKPFLFISVPPSVMPEPSSGKVVVRKDTTVTLECKANGNPSPSVTWTKRSFSSQLYNNNNNNNNNNNKNVEDEERRNVEHSQGRSVKIKRINKQGEIQNSVRSQISTADLFRHLCVRS